ncbi:MAG TPA: LON peptidase substrate-binding domain-containing protein, partial [Gemmatimonadales bacterium]|nr:LON peptidase substrate-binding domain-containing protein [Gemmatimonadales bacterium]
MTRELPIFPLPIVLFPGAPQALHIFEPRYRRMLQDCLAGDRRFGVAYVAADPAPDPARELVPKPGDVGCVAVIHSRQPLPDGRSDIVTVGERRFVLRRWVERDRPYRVADVDEFDDEPVDPDEVRALVADVRDRFARLTRAESVLGASPDDEASLPQDPARVSFLVAAALDLEPPAKCVLQAGRSTSARLRQLASVLQPLAADAERRATIR